MIISLCTNLVQTLIPMIHLAWSKEEYCCFSSARCRGLPIMPYDSLLEKITTALELESLNFLCRSIILYLHFPIIIIMVIKQEVIVGHVCCGLCGGEIS